jgi:hypothetical protein
MRKLVMLVTLSLVLAAGAAAVLTVYPQPASAGPQESEGPGGCGSRCR